MRVVMRRDKNSWADAPRLSFAGMRSGAPTSINSEDDVFLIADWVAAGRLIEDVHRHAHVDRGARDVLAGD